MSIRHPEEHRQLGNQIKSDRLLAFFNQVEVIQTIMNCFLNSLSLFHAFINLHIHFCYPAYYSYITSLPYSISILSSLLLPLFQSCTTTTSLIVIPFSSVSITGHLTSIILFGKRNLLINTSNFKNIAVF